jgi:integrase
MEDDQREFFEDLLQCSKRFMVLGKDTFDAAAYMGKIVERYIGREQQKEKQSKKETVLITEHSQEFSTQTKGVEMRKNCYKRKDGRWQYSKQTGGYIYYAIANTYRELLEKIPKIKPALKKSVKHKTKKTNQNTFIQYYQFFIDSFIKNKKISEHTKVDWQRQLTHDITPEFKYLKLEDVTAEKIQKFIDNIPFERKQETMYQRILKVLKKAYATGKIKRDITLGVEKPKRQNKSERSPLTFHEQIQLLKAVKNSKIYTFVIFSLIVGSRREETFRFKLDDIDEKRLTIHIKGTKTSNADRYVKVSRAFIDFLKSNMHEKFDFNLDYPTHELREIFKKLNIKQACLHSLRHTCSANLYFLGANDKFRQMQLGHASIVTTNDIYTNIRENIPARRLRLIYGDLYPEFD